MTRVNVYVDGFNLYYRALKGGPHRWLDLNALALRILKDGEKVECIRYFTARVSKRPGADSDEAKRQHAYLSALGSLPNLKTHYGRFKPVTKMRPLVTRDGGVGRFVSIHDSEEKGSDVNLATYLLHDAHRGNFDAALVLSQDSDLLEPIRLVGRDLKLPVGVCWLDGKRPSKPFKTAAGFMRHLTNADLNASHFPVEVKLRNDKIATKPDGW